MARHSSDDLIDPVQVDEDIEEQRQRRDELVRQAMADWSARVPGPVSMARTRLALVDLPLAAVRPYLRSGGPVPEEIDGLVQDALEAPPGEVTAAAFSCSGLTLPGWPSHPGNAELARRR